MSFTDAVSTVLTKKYADFSGRARRSEFWWFFLLSVVVLVLAYSLSLALETIIPYAVAALALLVPTLAAQVRRLHDTGRTGWLVLIGLIPFAGFLLLFWYAGDSEPGANAYGPSPKSGDAEPVSQWGQPA